MAALALVFGLVISALGGWVWANRQSSQASQGSADTASVITQALTDGIQRDVDFEKALGQMIATSPSPTNSKLMPWLKSLNIGKNYPGTVGVIYVQRVSANDLAQYESAVTADPVPGYGPGPYPLYPAGSRPIYCLVRFGITIENTAGIPPGSDFCASDLPGAGTSLMPPVLNQAAASGEVQLISNAVVPYANANSSLIAAFTQIFKDRVIAASPVYSAGSEPATATARAESVTGWVVVTFKGSTALASALGSTRGLAVELTSHGKVVASVGSLRGKGLTSLTRPLPGLPGLTVTVTHRPTSAPFIQGILLGFIAAAITMLAFAFLFHLGRATDRALQLVAERTKQLRYQALHDELTGLPNRALLFDRAELMLSRARRQPRAIGALFLDVDDFKDVNDTLGHNAGDELLKVLSERLRTTLRDSDTVGRLGGDEFLILTDDDTSDAGPELVAERILAALREPFVLDVPHPVTLDVQVSIGIAKGPRATAEELIRDADVALYQAKDAGKSRYATFRPEMQMAIQDRLSLETDLRKALDNGELFVEYQPIFDLAKLTTKGFEALVRWRHPTRGVMQPDQFIPLAEQSGLIVAIGYYVLEQACKQAVAWNLDGDSLGVSVNVSAVQFEIDDFVENVERVLIRHGLSPRALTLEITETVLMRDPHKMGEKLEALKRIGVRIAVDDFGTGYSSIAYLRQFPIDSLKIDRSFITKASQSPQSTALVHTLVQLGKALGIETLAEGIEQSSQLTRLQQESCDSGQGFLFARPLPPDQIAPFLANRGRHESNKPAGVS